VPFFENLDLLLTHVKTHGWKAVESSLLSTIALGTLGTGIAEWRNRKILKDPLNKKAIQFSSNQANAVIAIMATTLITFKHISQSAVVWEPLGLIELTRPEILVYAMSTIGVGHWFYMYKDQMKKLLNKLSCSPLLRR